jgi:transcriptional regulator with XRE-family HTH domain
MYGRILRQLRESKGRLQAEVARSVEISPAQLARLESNQRGRSPDRHPARALRPRLDDHRETRPAHRRHDRGGAAAGRKTSTEIIKVGGAAKRPPMTD